MGSTDHTHPYNCYGCSRAITMQHEHAHMTVPLCSACHADTERGLLDSWPAEKMIEEFDQFMALVQLCSDRDPPAARLLLAKLCSVARGIRTAHLDTQIFEAVRDRSTPV